MEPATDVVSLKTQLRQICTEVGEVLFRKRDLDLEVKAVNMRLEGLVKQRDEIERQLAAAAGQAVPP